MGVACIGDNVFDVQRHIVVFGKFDSARGASDEMIARARHNGRGVRKTH